MSWSEHGEGPHKISEEKNSLVLARMLLMPPSWFLPTLSGLLFPPGVGLIDEKREPPLCTSLGTTVTSCSSLCETREFPGYRMLCAGTRNILHKLGLPGLPPWTLLCPWGLLRPGIACKRFTGATVPAPDQEAASTTANDRIKSLSPPRNPQ